MFHLILCPKLHCVIAKSRFTLTLDSAFLHVFAFDDDGSLGFLGPVLSSFFRLIALTSRRISFSRLPEIFLKILLLNLSSWHEEQRNYIIQRLIPLNCVSEPLKYSLLDVSANAAFISPISPSWKPNFSNCSSVRFLRALILCTYNAEIVNNFEKGKYQTVFSCVYRT